MRNKTKKKNNKFSLSESPKWIRMLYTYLPGIWFPALFVFLLLSYKGHLAYMESSSLFLHTGAYFDEVVMNPGGFTVWIANFLTQYFKYPVAGALLLTLVPLLLYFVIRSISKKLGVITPSLLFIGIPVVTVSLFFLSKDDTYAAWISFMLAFAFFLGYATLRNQKYGLILYTLLGAPLFYLLLPTFGFITLYLAFILAIRNSNLRTGEQLTLSLIWIVLLVFIPWYGYKYLTFATKQTVWLAQTTDLIYLELPLLIVALWIQNKNGIVAYRCDRIVSSFLLVGLGILLFNYRYNQPEETVLSMDKAANAGNWDEVLAVSDRQKGYNRQMLYLTAIALANKGELGDRLFHYPVSGKSSCYLPRAFNYINSSLAGLLFEHVGLANGVLITAFDASMMAKYDFSFRSLKKLAVYNIEKGNLALADKYLSIIEKSTLYGKWAANERKLMEDRWVTSELDMEVENDFFINPSTYVDNFESMLIQHPHNQRACDWALTFCLLEKNLDRFVTIFVQYFMKQKRSNFPIHYQEALMVAKATSHPLLKELNFKFEDKAVTRYKQFQTACKMAKSSNNASLLANFQDTWWFFYLFVDIDTTTGASPQIPQS